MGSESSSAINNAAAPSAYPNSHIVDGSGFLVSAATINTLFMSLFAFIDYTARATAVVPAFVESVKSAVIIFSLKSRTSAISDAESFSV